MTNLNQLLLKFNYKQDFNYDDFFVSKSNFFAFEMIEKWPRWEKNILNVHGDKFSGKTHLANIFHSKNKGIKIYENQINNEIFKKFKLYENVCFKTENCFGITFSCNKEQTCLNKNSKLYSNLIIFQVSPISLVLSFFGKPLKNHIYPYFIKNGVLSSFNCQL